ncbi:MAG TPA: hypothetical protein VK528_12670 [Flavobacterium sp.]|nr:hypothetical protein [Flavobacterium sp.]
MSTKVSKAFLYHALFVICVAVPYINIYELTFALWSLTVFVTLREKYSLSFLQYIGYFLSILVIATIVAFFQKDLNSYSVIRDITYLLKPVLGLTAGYQLCKNYFKNPMDVVVNTAAIIAVLHLGIITHAYIFFHVRNINDLRMYGGYFSDFEVYALIILLFYKKFELDLSKRRILIYIVLIAVSSALYLARTNFIQLVILFLAMSGYFVINRKSIIVFSTLLALSLVGYALIYNSNPQRGAKGLEALFYKIKIAPFEPFKTKVDKHDWVDFNDNYRSYENIQTVRQVSNNGWKAVVFGEGLGSQIDLKTRVWLQTSFMRYIPFLHNGFMTVFLKSGLLGVCLYLFAIAYFFRSKQSNVPLVNQINLLFVGTFFFLFVSNWVFVGFYNLFDTKTLLLGFLIAYRERLNKSIPS